MGAAAWVACPTAAAHHHGCFGWMQLPSYVHSPACPRSELARLGKEKILFAARERLLGVRGRTALLSPTVQASAGSGG